MPRIALQLSENLIAGVCEMMGVEDHDIFGDRAYAVVEGVSPTKFTFELMSAEEIFVAAADDPELQIISV
jgi:hypothetical protein